jgi:hypothetical protein
VTYIPTKKSSKNDIIEEQRVLAQELDTITEAEKLKVMRFIFTQRSAFLSEISWETGVNEYRSREILNALWAGGFLEIIPVHPIIPDERLFVRVPDQARIGQSGFANFCKKRWFGLTNDGLEWLYERDAGSRKFIDSYRARIAIFPASNGEASDNQ